MAPFDANDQTILPRFSHCSPLYDWPALSNLRAHLQGAFESRRANRLDPENRRAHPVPLQPPNIYISSPKLSGNLQGPQLQQGDENSPLHRRDSRSDQMICIKKVLRLHPGTRKVTVRSPFAAKRSALLGIRDSAPCFCQQIASLSRRLGHSDAPFVFGQLHSCSMKKLRRVHETISECLSSKEVRGGVASLAWGRSLKELAPSPASRFYASASASLPDPPQG